MKIYLVGGAVRDRLLGLTIKDRDWLVVGATPAEMIARGFTQVGRDFPVFIHPKTGEEYALARTERKMARGHHGFAFDFDASITAEEDLARRDLTINAIAEAEDGSLLDPYGGEDDIKARILRHVSPAFSEDPLRVLRLMRFWARFAPLGFSIAPETWELCAQMRASGELEDLTKERIFGECEKALVSADPVKFFLGLNKIDALSVLGLSVSSEGIFSEMKERLQAACLITDNPAPRLAMLLQMPDCAPLRAALQKTLPLPKPYIFWLKFAGEHGETVKNWHSCKPSERLAALKMSGDLRGEGEVILLAQLMGATEETISTIQAAKKRLHAIDNQSFIKRGLQGAALGEAIKNEQLTALGNTE